MNSRDEVMFRMVQLFPKNIVKGYFKEEIKKDASLLEVIKRTEDADIFEFVRSNFDFTKQHVYVLKHGIKKLNNLPKYILNRDAMKYTGEGIIEYYDFYDVRYKIYLQEPYEVVNLVFKCPIHIVVYKNLIVIHLTILERRNMQSYFLARKVLTARKSIEEIGVVSLITNDIGKYGALLNCDLNKGIKELWKRDIIDAIEIQYLRAKSTSKETMHEEYTFKQQYPKLYTQAIRAPLKKASFKFLASKGEYCDHFAIEPSSGKLTFPIFSKKKEHNQNVIRKILEFN